MAQGGVRWVMKFLRANKKTSGAEAWREQWIVKRICCYPTQQRSETTHCSSLWSGACGVELNSLVNEGKERTYKHTKERNMASANQRRDISISIRQTKLSDGLAVTHDHGYWLRPTALRAWRERGRLSGAWDEMLIWIWSFHKHVLPILPWLYVFQPPLGPGIATVICVGPSGLCLLQMQYDVVKSTRTLWAGRLGFKCLPG